MNLFNLIIINLKKLKIQRTKALFLIVPLVILMLLSVVVSSQVHNFREAIDESVFGTLKEQATLLQIAKVPAMPEFRSRSGSSFQVENFDNTYSSNDLAAVMAVDHVISASLNSTIPISNIFSTDLFDGITYNISSLSELDATSAKLFAEGDFSYTEGQAIPIILNASSFVQRYEDWGGQTEITMNMQEFRQFPSSSEDRPDPQALADLTPIKTKAIDYVKEDLLGKTFTISFGGLDAIQDYKISMSGSSRTFSKLTEDEMAALVAERQSAISQYWDYAKISTPITYTFVVVGVIEDSTSNSTYIPADFANVLMKTYVQNQLDAQVATVPTDDLDQTFLGTSFDGTELSSGTGFGFGRNFFVGSVDGGMGRSGAMAFSSQGSSTDSYNIPGLIIKTASDGSNTVEGIYADANVYVEAAKSAEVMTIRVDSVYNRTAVVEALNALGYAYQDTNNFGVFEKIQSTIQTISSVFAVGFIVLVSSVVIFAMSRFVAESRKEIGIFRAMGMKKLSVLFMFTSQALIYSVVASLIGLGVGIGINTLLAATMERAFNSFVGETIKETFNVANTIEPGLFTHIDVSTVVVYFGVLLLIALVVSLVPAYQASRVSPVEAIRGE